MRLHPLVVLGLFGFVLGGHATEQPAVVLYEGSKKAFSGSVAPWSSSGMTSCVKGLLGFPAGSSSEAEEIEALLSDRLFDRPGTIVALHLLGLDASALSGGAASVPLAGFGAKEAGDSADRIMQLARGSKRVHDGSLDHDAMAGCDKACVEREIASVLEASGATLDGTRVTLKNGAQLDSSDSLHRAFLVDLASVARGFASAAARRRDGRPELLEGVVGTLQGLRSLYGAQSDIFTGAAEALSGTVSRGMQQLSAARGGDVAGVVVATTDLATASQKPLDVLLLPRAITQRRRQLAASSYSSTTPLTQKVWTNRTSAVIGFLVFFIGAFAGVYVLTYMDLNQDPLLYPRKQF